MGPHTQDGRWCARLMLLMLIVSTQHCENSASSAEQNPHPARTRCFRLEQDQGGGGKQMRKTP
jgi:hypothetical protein